jgi:hypothetical protein
MNIGMRLRVQEKREKFYSLSDCILWGRLFYIFLLNLLAYVSSVSTLQVGFVC